MKALGGDEMIGPVLATFASNEQFWQSVASGASGRARPHVEVVRALLKSSWMDPAKQTRGTLTAQTRTPRRAPRRAARRSATDACACVVGPLTALVERGVAAERQVFELDTVDRAKWQPRDGHELRGCEEQRSAVGAGQAAAVHGVVWLLRRVRFEGAVGDPHRREIRRDRAAFRRGVPAELARQYRGRRGSALERDCAARAA
jgi:hypothetical protein